MISGFGETNASGTGGVNANDFLLALSIFIKRQKNYKQVKRK